MAWLPAPRLVSEIGCGLGVSPELIPGQVLEFSVTSSVPPTPPLALSTQCLLEALVQVSRSLITQVVEARCFGIRVTMCCIIHEPLNQCFWTYCCVARTSRNSRAYGVNVHKVLETLRTRNRQLPLPLTSTAKVKISRVSAPTKETIPIGCGSMLIMYAPRYGFYRRSAHAPKYTATYSARSRRVNRSQHLVIRQAVRGSGIPWLLGRFGGLWSLYRC